MSVLGVSFTEGEHSLQRSFVFHSSVFQSSKGIRNIIDYLMDSKINKKLIRKIFHLNY